MDGVQLRFSQDAEWACLRELSGREEWAVSDGTTVGAIRLLNAVLVQPGGRGLAPGRSSSLTASDRDRLLAEIYKRTYGPRVESTVTCVRCSAPFDLDFSVEELLGWRTSPGGKTTHVATRVEQHPDGTYGSGDGRRFRLPTGEDECAVLGLSSGEAEAELLRRCVLGEEGGDDKIAQGTSLADDAGLQVVMEAVAPILDLELEARCPECDESQALHFDIQHYLLTALKKEQGRLAEEVHLLARAYGWSLNEILSLTRGQRKNLVALVEAERT